MGLERAAKIRDDRGQQTIISGINSMQYSEVEKTMKKLEVVYYIARSCLSHVSLCCGSKRNMALT